MSASKLRPYPEYKESNIRGLGKIPLHWSVERLATLGRISKGSGGSKEDNVESGLPCIRYGDLYTHHNFIVKDFKTQISAESASRYTILDKGDILFAASGESIEEIGKSVLFNLDETAYCGGDNIICKTGGADDSDFLGFATNAPYFAAQKSMVGRGYTVLHIYGTQLRDLRLALPPIEERKAISNFISQNKNLLDSQIRALENLLPLLEENCSNIISKVVTKGLNPNTRTKDSGIEWLGDIPSHWTVMRMRFLCKITTGGRDTQDAEDEGEFPFFVRSPHIEKISTYSFDGEAVLTSGDGAGVGKIYHHYIGKLDFHQRVYLFSNFNHIKGRLFYQFIKENLKTEVLSLSAKSTVDSIRLPMLQNFPIAYGSEKEQMEILNHIERVEKLTNQLVEKTRRKVTLLKEYRTAIISAAVTGKIDVRGL